jgi:methylated-DNA-[protein]-cysteine S-methyltransferase
MSKIESSDIFLTAQGWMGVLTTEAGILYSVLPLKQKDDVIEELETLSGQGLGKIGVSTLTEEIGGVMTQYFEGEAVDLIKFPLDFDGVPHFFKKVYEVVRNIERGRVMSYGDVAKMAGSPRGARAVGAAMARNPFPPFVPCHRVVGRNGDLVGFGGGSGIALKEEMLRLEGVDGKLGQKFSVLKKFFV